ncbi:MAG: type I DNA topoisomerase [Bacteroidetes bacterium]|nr:type I DNA topoisomerase [Bacteroidota bacterium]
MAKNLVIVESPAKAKTIEGFLGKDYVVKSSFGHVRDLVKKDLGINVEKNFTPTYEVQPDKTKVIDELKKLSGKAEMVWLASDEDREGEAISWHLFEALNLDKNRTKRIVFHEITKPAIQKAIQNPRGIDINLVNAQQARRILDRLVGFELSPVLWRKVKPSLSAGRVQSVAVRLIVEREREIQQFQSLSSFKVSAIFQTEKNQVKAELSERFKTEAEAEAFLKKCIPAIYTVNSLETKPAKRSPAAPFTTSTLQQEAARKLGFSVAQTMTVAQRLYEAGKITYMRTDSVNLSETALNQAQEAIISNFGEKYHQQRRFKTKSKGAQEAHEAIRPTYIQNQTIAGERNEQRLYDLIWKRTIASQMADAELEKTNVKIGISTAPQIYTAQGEVLKFDGFLKVYIEGTDDEGDEENSTMLPSMKQGQTLLALNTEAVERFTHHPPRYTEASLVKKLEELGIGRPSTYAPTISTVQKRNYVEKGDRMGSPRNFTVLAFSGKAISKEIKTENTGAEKAKLFPTDIGAVVTDFLIQYFPEILDYHFTAKVEEEFDDIAEGKIDWTKMLNAFYKPFHKTVENTIDNSERASGERLLGEDPVSKKPVYVRIGRFGPLAQIGDSLSETNEEKPRFASLRKEQSIETITLQEALDLFKLPLTIGTHKNNDVVVAVGRFGPYIKFGEQFISIPRNEDPLSVDLQRAIELIKEKEIANAPIAHYKGVGITKGKGRFGPFIKFGDLYINVPRAYDFENLSQKEIEELVDKKLEKEANRFIQQWPEENIAIENGRWGPFIRFKKDMLKLTKAEDGKRHEPEALKHISLEEVKRMIVEQVPNAFDKKAKKKAANNKAEVKSETTKNTVAKKKATVKKAASKKAAVKKAAIKKGKKK